MTLVPLVTSIGYLLATMALWRPPVAWNFANFFAVLKEGAEVAGPYASLEAA